MPEAAPVTTNRLPAHWFWSVIGNPPQVVSRSADPARHALDGMDEVAGQVFRPCDLESRHAVEQLVENLPQLHLGDEIAHAEVRAATAETHVRVRVAGDVEAVRVDEHVLVAVARGVDHRDPVPGPQVLSGQ